MRKLKPRRIKILNVNYSHNEMERFGMMFSGIDDDGFSFELLFSDSLENARDIFFNEHPDLVFIHETFEHGNKLSRFIRAHEGERHTGILFTLTRFGQQLKGDAHKSSAVVLEKGADEVINLECSNREFLARVKSILRIKTMTDELRRANHKLEVLSLTDELTGLANMRCFYKRYSELMSECRNGDLALGILLFDLDHFKQVNDTTNHLVGSQVLADLGKLLRSTSLLGKRDVAARFGGDEFVLCIICENPELLAEKSEHLRALIEGHVFQIEETRLKVTASIGAAWVYPKYKASLDIPIKAADHLLYDSKHKGRNCVSVSDLLRNPVKFNETAQTQMVHVVAKKFEKAG